MKFAKKAATTPRNFGNIGAPGGAPLAPDLAGSIPATALDNKASPPDVAAPPVAPSAPSKGGPMFKRPNPAVKKKVKMPFLGKAGKLAKIKS